MQTAIADEFGAGFHQTHIHQIERADADRGNRKGDADALAVTENLFFERQTERVGIDATRQQFYTPTVAEKLFIDRSSSGDLSEGKQDG